MNSSEFLGVDANNLVRVAFNSYVDTSAVLRISLWSCCISATSASVKSIISNGDSPISAFTKTNLFLIYESVQYLFIFVLIRIGYIGTSAPSNL